MLESLGMAARLQESDFLKILARNVAEMSPEHGGKYVGALYKALSPPDGRLGE